MAVDAGADCVGVVVEYPVPVPWNLNREEAAELLPLVPCFVSRAVVTGGPVEVVLSIAYRLRPHLVQLHTDNPVEETAGLAGELAGAGIGLIRALRIDVASGSAIGETPDPLEAARALQDTGICGLVVDARTDKLPAGTGQTLDWALVRRIRDTVRVPVILAGGLTPANVREAISAVRPYAVDVITGVESARRVKDPALVREFVRRARCRL